MTQEPPATLFQLVLKFISFHKEECTLMRVQLQIGFFSPLIAELDEVSSAIPGGEAAGNAPASRATDRASARLGVLVQAVVTCLTYLNSLSFKGFFINAKC